MHETPDTVVGRDSRSKTKDRQFVTALARGLRILRCFDRHTSLLSATEIARTTGLPQPTVWRLCHTLEKLGYLESDAGSEKLHLGSSAMVLGAAAISGRDALDMARPLMQTMADRYHSAVALGNYNADSIIYVLRCQGDSALLMNLHIGSVISLYRSAIGRAYIASSPPPEREHYLEKASAMGDSDITEIEDAIQFYEQHAYLTFYRPKYYINTVATTFTLPDGKRYAISCGGPASSLPADLVETEVGPSLVELAKKLQPLFLHGKNTL